MRSRWSNCFYFDFLILLKLSAFAVLFYRYKLCFLFDGITILIIEQIKRMFNVTQKWWNMSTVRDQAFSWWDIPKNIFLLYDQLCYICSSHFPVYIFAKDMGRFISLTVLGLLYLRLFFQVKFTYPGFWIATN